MKIVAVVAYTINIAHVYMAREVIEQKYRKCDYKCKAEAQGGMGTENELDEDEIVAVDAVILAIAIGIEGGERFEEKEEEGKIVKISPSVVIRGPAEIIDQAEKL